MPLTKTYESVGFFGMHGKPLYPGKPLHQLRLIQSKIDSLIEQMKQQKDFIWNCQNSINELALMLKQEGKLTSHQEQRLKSLVETQQQVQTEFNKSNIMNEISQLWLERDQLLYGDAVNNEIASAKTLSASL